MKCSQCGVHIETEYEMMWDECVSCMRADKLYTTDYEDAWKQINTKINQYPRPMSRIRVQHRSPSPAHYYDSLDDFLNCP